MGGAGAEPNKGTNGLRTARPANLRTFLHPRRGEYRSVRRSDAYDEREDDWKATAVIRPSAREKSQWKETRETHARTRTGNANRNRVRRRGRENEVEERRIAGFMAVALAPIYRLPEPFNRAALCFSPSAPRRD